MILQMSTRKHKKWMVVMNKGGKKRTIHFGDDRYQDYTQHKDKERRKNYRARASKIKNKGGKLTIRDPFTPNALAYYVLWGDSINVDKNFKDFKKRFHI